MFAYYGRIVLSLQISESCDDIVCFCRDGWEHHGWGWLYKNDKHSEMTSVSNWLRCEGRREPNLPRQGGQTGVWWQWSVRTVTDFKLKVSPPCQGKDEVPAAAVRCQNVIYLFSAFCAAFWDTATILRQGLNHNINFKQPKIFRIPSSVKCALAWNWFVIDTNEK